MSEAGQEAQIGEDPRLVLGSRTLELLGVESLEAIEIQEPWHRGGSETYVSDFILKNGEDYHHLIAKACIKFDPSKVLDEWLARRNRLAAYGVSFPQLLATHAGVMVEEFIPYSFSNAYHLADANGKDTLHSAWLATYRQIRMAGFSPASLHDVRSRGDDAVVIDVGEDMGPPSDRLVDGLLVAVEAEQYFQKCV